MIRKFAAVSGFMAVLAALCILQNLAAGQDSGSQPAQEQPAQQAPAPQPQAPQTQSPQTQSPQTQSQQTQPQQTPDTSQSGQEPSPEESTSRRVKPRAYKNWNFNVGGGASLTNGTTKTFVRSGGGIAAAGVARNYSQYFGFRADFQWDNLPLRNSALQLAQAPGATSQVYSVMVDPIITLPVAKLWDVYVVFGPSYFHRSGKLNSSTALPGTACNSFFAWWGTCYAGSLPLGGKFLTESQNEFGENFGGGVAHKLRPNLEIYAEFRYLHGARHGLTTDLRPITVGVRW
jgi:opacity protein-like surface antigen